MLQHIRLNEVIAKDTFVASDMSLEGYYCAQVFFGMTSRGLSFRVNTESEFPDEYLGIIIKI
jgi:hypothetical protein